MRIQLVGSGGQRASSVRKAAEEIAQACAKHQLTFDESFAALMGVCMGLCVAGGVDIDRVHEQINVQYHALRAAVRGG